MGIDEFLDLLDNVQARGDDAWVASCPGPRHDNGDRNPSLSIRVTTDRILVYCFLCKEAEIIVAAMGRTMADLFLSPNGNGAGPPPVRATVAGFAARKQLPVDFLTDAGLVDVGTGLRFTYYRTNWLRADRDRIRLTLDGPAGPWTKGTDPISLYGLHRLADARTMGIILFVEGESDALTAWFHNIPALGFPGADMAKSVMAEYLDGIATVVVVREPGAGGTTFVQGIAARLTALGWTGTARVVTFDGAKDVSDLHGQAGDAFDAQFDAAVNRAVPLATALAEPSVDVTEPDDEDEDAETYDALVFPDIAWRDAFATYRDSLAGRFEAPVVNHFAALAAVAAARLRRRVWIWQNIQLFPNVYVVVYGATGKGKTSSMRMALQYLPPDDSVCLITGLGSAEGVADAMGGVTGPAPATLFFVEETATMLARGNWAGSALIPFLMEAFDTPREHRVRFRKNPILVLEPTPSLVGGTTPEFLWKHLTEVDFFTGFGNRIFFLTGPPGPPIPLPEKPDDVGRLQVARAMDRLAFTPEGEMRLAPEAAEIWTAFYVPWVTTLATREPLIQAALGRIRSYALKFAMLYAALEGTAPAITAPQIEAGIAVAQYGAQCTERLLQTRVTMSAQGRVESLVVETLMKGDMAVYQMQRDLNKRAAAQDLNRAVTELTKARVIIVKGQGPRGAIIYGLPRRRTRPR